MTKTTTTEQRARVREALDAAKSRVADAMTAGVKAAQAATAPGAKSRAHEVKVGDITLSWHIMSADYSYVSIGYDTHPSPEALTACYAAAVATSAQLVREAAADIARETTLADSLIAAYGAVGREHTDAPE